MQQQNERRAIPLATTTTALAQTRFRMWFLLNVLEGVLMFLFLVGGRCWLDQGLPDGFWQQGGVNSLIKLLLIPLSIVSVGSLSPFLRSHLRRWLPENPQALPLPAGESTVRILTAIIVMTLLQGIVGY